MKADQHDFFERPAIAPPPVRPTFARVRAMETLAGWGPLNERELSERIGCNPEIETLIAGGLVERKEMHRVVRHVPLDMRPEILCKITERGREWLRRLTQEG